MTRFRVVTDSTSDVPPAWCERWGITVVPLTVHFGQESFADGVDLTNEEFFDQLKGVESLPTTSAPSPGAFADGYRRLSGECEAVVSIHISSTLSATAEAARLGAEWVDRFPVHVVDCPAWRSRSARPARCWGPTSAPARSASPTSRSSPQAGRLDSEPPTGP